MQCDFSGTLLLIESEDGMRVGGFVAKIVLVACFLGLQGCAARSPGAQRPTGNVVLSFVGTNDLHGHVEALPILGGYLANLRAARTRDGGAVVLLDAGDMFQGTIESNLQEGSPVVQAYGALGYDAVTIGNHEFDYGPEGALGPLETTLPPGTDWHGALRARAREARFPFLTANVVEEQSRQRISWQNVLTSTVIERAGVRIGVFGATSEDTPRTTAGFHDLRVESLRETFLRESSALRARGAQVVVALVHAGGRCRSFDQPEDASSCEREQELFRVMETVPPGTLDLVIAGHTHAGVAHFVHGTPVLESHSYGRAFGRADLTVDRSVGRVTHTRVFPPRDLCARRRQGEACDAGTYEGTVVTPSSAVTAVLAPAVERARAERERSIGVTLTGTLRREFGEESPLGNLLADLLREAANADVGVINGGGIRANLSEGLLTYGAVYEVLPFDNRLVTVVLSTAALRSVLQRNLTADNGVLSLSGVRVRADCTNGSLQIALTRSDGTPVPEGATLRVAVSDFLAEGGDGLFGNLEGARIERTPGTMMREAVEASLRRRGNALRANDPAFFDPSNRRMVYPSRRPVRCER